jgi:uncharacterized membrane protein
LTALCLLPEPGTLLQLGEPAPHHLWPHDPGHVAATPPGRGAVLALVALLCGLQLGLAALRGRLDGARVGDGLARLAWPFACFGACLLLPALPLLGQRLMLVAATGLYVVAIADRFHDTLRAWNEIAFRRLGRAIVCMLGLVVLLQLPLLIWMRGGYAAYAADNEASVAAKLGIVVAGLSALVLTVAAYLWHETATGRGSAPPAILGRPLRAAQSVASASERAATRLTAALTQAAAAILTRSTTGGGSIAIGLVGGLLLLAPFAALRRPFLPYERDLLVSLLLPLMTVGLGCLAAAATGIAGGERPVQRGRRRGTAVALAVLVPAAAVYAFYFGALAVERLQAFIPQAFDLSFYNQALWMISFEGLPTLTIGEAGGFSDRVFLSDHAPLLYYAFVPIYRLWPGPETLLVLQSLFIALGALPVFLLGRHHLRSSGWGLALALAYLLYPGLQILHVWDVHPLPFSIVFFLWALYAYERGRKTWFLGLLLLGGLVREDMPLFVISAGLMLLVTRRDTRWGARALLLGGLQFFLVTGVLQSYFGGGPKYPRFDALYFFEGNYSLSGIVYTMLFNPVFFLKTSLVVGKLTFALQLLSPLLFAALLTGRGLTLCLAGIASTVLSPHVPHFTLGYQYAVPLIVALFYLSPLGLRRARAALRRRAVPGARRVVSPVLLVGLLGGAVLWSHAYGILLSPTLPLGFYRGWDAALLNRAFPEQHLYRGWQVVTLRRPRVSEESESLRALVDSIPPAARVSAPDHVTVPLSGRRVSYNLPRVDDAEYVVLHPGFWPVYPPEAFHELGFREVGRAGGAILLHRRTVRRPGPP